MFTHIMPVTDLRRDTRAVIDSVRESGDVVYITRHGRPVVVLVDYAQYEQLRMQKRVQTWPQGYFEATYGSLADDPITRPASESRLF